MSVPELFDRGIMYLAETRKSTCSARPPWCLLEKLSLTCSQLIHQTSLLLKTLVSPIRYYYSRVSWRLIQTSSDPYALFETSGYEIRTLPELVPRTA